MKLKKARNNPAAGNKYGIWIQLIGLYAILITSALAVFLFYQYRLDVNSNGKGETIVFREDFNVVFSQSIMDRLNDEYDADGPESLYCLMGRQHREDILVDSLVEQELVYQSAEIIVYVNDPPCQIPGAVGSLHSHPKYVGCTPSRDDLFTFGEMKDPEPLINVVQCDIDKFFIFKMPGPQESFDFRLLRWEVE